MRISGFEPGAETDADTARLLADAFARAGLLVFEQLGLDVDQQLRLAQVFGTPVVREKNATADVARRTQHVSNVLDDGVFGTGELDFHLDQLFWSEPLKALMLYGLVIPANGSETRFVDTSLVYRRMPAALRERIDDCYCEHAYTFSGQLASDWHVKDAATQNLAVQHPMVWRDPASEHVGLWVNKLTTLGVCGLDRVASDELIAEVRGYLYDPDCRYEHHWRPGDLVVWDNRRFQHARMPFDESEPRTLRRTTLL